YGGGSVESGLARGMGRGRDGGGGNGRDSWEEVESGLRMALQEMLATVGPNSKERRTVVGLQFRQLEGLFLPSYARFLLWLMSQGKSFFGTAPHQNPDCLPDLGQGRG
ncbi:unnamed protein product, partial [Discosporangium mesarthrocarpum]